jgi:hypothetical protein
VYCICGTVLRRPQMHGRAAFSSGIVR